MKSHEDTVRSPLRLLPVHLLCPKIGDPGGRGSCGVEGALSPGEHRASLADLLGEQPGVEAVDPRNLFHPQPLRRRTSSEVSARYRLPCLYGLRRALPSTALHRCASAMPLVLHVHCATSRHVHCYLVRLRAQLPRRTSLSVILLFQWLGVSQYSLQSSAETWIWSLSTYC